MNLGHLRFVDQFYRGSYEELQELVNLPAPNKRDEMQKQLAEGYEHYSKKEIKDLFDFYKRVFDGIEIIKAEKKQTSYATAFPNLSGDTILVVPMPKKGKSYATLKDFADNAPAKQQQELWKLVAKQAKKQVKKFRKVWISTHGLGVPYLHVRISSQPKYYFDTNLANQ